MARMEQLEGMIIECRAWLDAGLAGANIPFADVLLRDYREMVAELETLKSAN